MNRIFQCLLHVAGLCWALLAAAPALAQITNVTDGTTSTTTCTSYTFSATGILTFSPMNCLLAPPPPPVTPVYSFTSGSTQVVEDTLTSTVTVRRSGADLSSNGTVLVRYVPGTALPNIHFNVTLDPPFVVSGPDLQIPVTFTGVPSVTTQEYNFTVYIVNASLPGGTSKSLSFNLLSPTGGTLGATASHAFTITSAAPPPPITGDTDINGVPLPNLPAVGTYPTRPFGACEQLYGTQLETPPFPGLGGSSPCGSYRIKVSEPTRVIAGVPAAYDCNAGMGQAAPHVVTDAYMLLFEDLKVGNTYAFGNDLRYAQHKSSAFVIKFKTGNAGEFPFIGGSPPSNLLGQFTFAYVYQGNRGEPGIRFAALSTKPCDFDYAKYDAGNGCYRNLNVGGGGSVLTEVLSFGSAAPNICGLAPNTVYYLSTRWEDVGAQNGGVQQRGKISCTPTTSNYCGTSLNIN